MAAPVLSAEQQAALARVIASINQSVQQQQQQQQPQQQQQSHYDGVGFVDLPLPLPLPMMMPAAPWVPVTTPAFTARLERAMAKNMDYIRRYGGRPALGLLCVRGCFFPDDAIALTPLARDVVKGKMQAC